MSNPTAPDNAPATAHGPSAAQMASPGTSQGDRLHPHLAATHAPLDDREPVDIVLAARAIAGALHHFDVSPTQPAGRFDEVLLPLTPAERAVQQSLTDALAQHPSDVATHTALRARLQALLRARLHAMLHRDDGQVPPHLALLMAYAQLASQPRAVLNDFTRRHLAFQMQTVLGFQPRPALPDHAHVLVTLKKGAAPLALSTDQRLSAGKDSAGQALTYAPVRPTVLNHAEVAEVRSVGHAAGRLVMAPLARSLDGLGAKLPAERPVWSPFALPLAGRPTLPVGVTGFALASPLLRLAEGQRSITLTLALDGLQAPHTPAALAASFEVLLTGPKGWLGPFPLTADTGAASHLRQFRCQLDADQPAVVDLSAVHLQAFEPGLPVLQCRIKADGPLGHDAMAGLSVRQVQLQVSVHGMSQLPLEGDLGAIDPKKAYLPFGPQAAPGSRFFIQSSEALGKTLSRLQLNLVWQGAPATQQELNTRYANYSGKAGLASGVSMRAQWADASARAEAITFTGLPAVGGSLSVPLLAPQARPFISKIGWPAALALFSGGSALARNKASLADWLRPRPSPVPAAPANVLPGRITLTLVTDLLHEGYRTDTIAKIVAQKPAELPAEPLTPKLQSLTLDYDAETPMTRLDLATEDSFTQADVALYHVDVFGVARVHPWLTTLRPWVQQGATPLLPPHAAGELYIGLRGVGAGEPVSLLLQAEAGSADPLATVQTVRWSVLADNSWHALPPGPDLPLDTTGDLRRSGLVQALLPDAVNTDNTLLPAGLVWLKAEVPGDPRAACQLVDVHANAIEVAYVDEGHAASHLGSALPAGAINKLLPPQTAIKALAQPYPSFDGALQEDEGALARRAAERLRHRQRAITAWDHERLVLDAFPQLARVKCVPYAHAGSWRAPGSVMLVVLPDLRQRAFAGVLQPRVDLDTLQRIEAFVLARSPLWLQQVPTGAPAGTTSAIAVRNPSYQAVRLAFKVRMRPGYAFSFYKGELNAALVRALSPWAFDADQTLDFGGRVVRSALVNFVEALPYVDHVTDVRLAREGVPGEDASELQPRSPDEILVSAALHLIEEIA
ncbi:MAG: hypothetical protein RI907_1158 [Pseudomonadota bacterium]|jgi:hypothetical protein